VAFNKRLPVTALFRAPTIEMLSKSLDRKLQTGVGGSQITSFQNGNVGLPLYFIGDGPGEYKLSKLIGQSYSIFGIEVPWPVAWRSAAEKNDAPSMPSMEELVAPYTQLLREGAQSRPCVIAGYSLHGMMAFEAAHQFIKEGGKVEKLILLDSLIDISPSFPFAALANYRRLLSRTGPADFWSISRWFVGQVLSRLQTRFSEEAEFGGIDEAGVPLQWELVRRIYVNARKNYHLRSLDSLGILIQANQMHEGPARYLHDGQGWNGLFDRGLKAIEVPGNHFTMLRDEANALVLAEVMRTLL
jgi:thioesterase domain-containing protein